MNEFEELPASLRKAVKRADVLRRFTLIVGWILVVLSFIYFGILPMKELWSASEGIPDFLLSIGFAILESFVVGGIFHGLSHLALAFKFTLRTFGLELLVGGLVFCVILFALSPVVGTIFLIADAISILHNHPLVYSFEYGFFDDAD